MVVKISLKISCLQKQWQNKIPWQIIAIGHSLPEHAWTEVSDIFPFWPGVFYSPKNLYRANFSYSHTVLCFPVLSLYFGSWILNLPSQTLYFPLFSPTKSVIPVLILYFPTSSVSPPPLPMAPRRSRTTKVMQIKDKQHFWKGKNIKWSTLCKGRGQKKIDIF